MIKKSAERLSYLIENYFNETATAVEETELWAYVNDPEYAESIGDLLPAAFDPDKAVPASHLNASQREAILANIFGEQQEERKTIRLWPRIAAAASILLVLSTGIYILLRQKQAGPQLTAQTMEQLEPVKKGVVLTLGNGQQVGLASVQNGLTHTADGAQVKHQENSIDYKANNQNKVEWHTLTNNSAQKYSVTLNDGTEVSLDIASSITYPTLFTGNERMVNVTGQSYFKVKHNARQPFRVHAGKVVIEDIGTEFNIEAYDQPVKTTLIEGEASVDMANHHVVLKPGKNAIAKNDDISVNDADLEEATSWLQGNFVFNHEPLESILTKVERIYGVHFVWQDEKLRKLKFNGLVSRSKKLATVLNYIRKTGPVDFLADGNNIKVIRKG